VGHRGPEQHTLGADPVGEPGDRWIRDRTRKRIDADRDATGGVPAGGVLDKQQQGQRAHPDAETREHPDHEQGRRTRDDPHRPVST
jgi:hypothetical protein